MSARRQNNPTPPTEWPINTHWRESLERVSQHWYITFCLLMSAVQDYLTAMVLKQHGNLNWTVTCRYYSMVHTGRLLAFVTVGDFPKMHGPLRNVFLETRNQPVNFNWLSGFPRSNVGRITVDRAAFFTALCTLLNGTADRPGGRTTVEPFGRALAALADLRNKANYEALLIAHEKHHRRVTRLFDQMERESDTLAANTVDLAVTTYLAYLKNHPILDQERSSYIGISNQYICGRLNLGITEKIDGCQRAGEELARLTQELTVHTDNDPDRTRAVEEVERRIVMEQFEGKNDLFDSVVRKVRALETVDWPRQRPHGEARP